MVLHLFFLYIYILLPKIQHTFTISSYAITPSNTNSILPPRAYPLGCSQNYNRTDSQSLKKILEKYNIPSRRHDSFRLIRKLGAGKFSDVFEAVDNDLGHNDGLCVIKCLRPIAEYKFRRELLVLSHITNVRSLVQIKGTVLPSSDYTLDPAIIFKHSGPNSSWFCHGNSNSGVNDIGNNNPPPHLTLSEVKYYTYHLLHAINSLHALGIMHRDIKPRNVLINRRWPPLTSHGSTSPVILIDMGLAEFYYPRKKYNVHIASRPYKAPELLLGYENYDYGIDMWGVGCILISLLLGKNIPLFRGKDNDEIMTKIVDIFGWRDLILYCEKYEIDIDKEWIDLLQMRHDNDDGYRKDWDDLVSHDKKKPCRIDKQGKDLVNKLLLYDHYERWTAREAMGHEFFDDIRNFAEEEMQFLQ